MTAGRPKATQKVAFKTQLRTVSQEIPLAPAPFQPSVLEGI